jgi:hypothetical protein
LAKITPSNFLDNVKQLLHYYLALQEKQSALLEKEAALAEVERLKALLAKKDYLSHIG